MGSKEITRRRLVESLGAAGLVGLAGCAGGDGDTTTSPSDGGDGGDGGTPTDTTTAPSDGGDGGTTTAQPVSGTVRIGVVQPLSGALQYYGRSALRGFFGGFKYKGGDAATIPEAGFGPGEYTMSVGDVDYRLFVGDTAGDSGEAQNLATEYVQNNDAQVLFGGTSSASAIAIANNVANRGQVPYMAGPAASVSITGSSENCGANVFRASENVAMDARSGGKYVAEETDIESVWIYYANYSFGQSINRNYSAVLEDNGITVAGSTALPRGYADDWPGQFQKATNAGVDAIIGGFTVATLPAMVGTFLANSDQYDFDFIGGWGTHAGTTAFGGVLQEQLGELTEEKIANAGMGALTTRYFWNQYDNPINDEFIDIHTSNYDLYPDLFASGTFTAASAFHEAVMATGSTARDDIRSGLTGLTVQDTPKGEGAYEFQEYNNQARSPMTVATAVPTGEDQYWDAAIKPDAPAATFGKDETTLPADSPLQTCSL